MAKKLTEQQVSDIIESTRAEMKSQEITDKGTVNKMDSHQIEDSKKEEKLNSNSVDKNKSPKSEQKKIVKILNIPMTLTDIFVKLFGKAFEPIFCIIIPMLVMFLPINYIAAGLVNNIAEFVTYAAIPILLFLLMFLPKVASAVEFPLLGLFLLGKTGILRFLSPSLADWIDPYGRLTYLPGQSPVPSAEVGLYQPTLAWGVIYAAIIFLFFKLFFFVYLKLKPYRRNTTQRRHKKKYVAQMDKDSGILM
ncbi:MAG: hypothetical protein J1F17_00305 [Oscillospiraceae bacterium]|nr:hypothetical protein [Oscillospiraceae bacterium]